ncbi:MAG: penicillin acylase family protein [Candidatus Omnitrophota bacterium]|nr:MAG: penicillin acylase family protein [Candidatus Omnitrophota bacterium]
MKCFYSMVLCLAVVFSAVAAEEKGKVEIIRDQWGVPHVFSDTDAGAMFGLGYATAEDRAFQMHYSLRIVQGRISEVLGEFQHRKQVVTSVVNDVKFRTMGVYRAAKEVAANLDQESKTLLQAYCDGVNDYMAKHPEKLLYLFKKYDLKPETWTPTDCIASWWHLGWFFAGEGLHDTLSYHRLKDERGQSDRDPRALSAARGGERSSRKIDRTTDVDLMPLGFDETTSVVRRDDVEEEWLKKNDAFMEKYGLKGNKSAGEEGPEFSHAWVVGGEKTTTGSAVLCSDPQTPVRNPSLLFEYHMCGKTFNVRGVGVAGSPILLIGWNENVAWGMTALGADQADQFLLKTDADHPNQYFYEGEWRDMSVWEETITVKGGETKTLMLKETHFGPVISSIAHDVRPGEEVSLKRVPLCIKDRDTMQGALAMMRAKDVREFQTALAGWLFPSANVVFGDKQGNIGYSVVGAIPIRSALALDEGNVSHDGTETKYDWQGYVPNELVPRVINPEQGILFSANHRPIGSFYTIPIGISTGSGGDTIRSWRLRERMMLKDVFTPDEVLDIHYDSVNPAKREIVRLGYHLRDVQKAKLSEETLYALEYLENWFKAGAKADLNVMGTELTNSINAMFRIVQTDLTLKYGGGMSGLSYFLKTVKNRIETDPQTKLNELEIEYIDHTLSSAWIAAENRYGYDPEIWYEQALKQLENQKLGYFESLDGYPSLDNGNDIHYPFLSVVDGDTILSQRAQSYTQWVPLHDVDAAMSILPIGHSEHPENPSRLSTYDLWSQGKLHPAPLTREAVQKVMEKSVSLSY